MRLEIRPTLFHPLSSNLRQPRQPSVGRIDNQRRTTCLNGRRAAIHPKIVVTTNAPARFSPPGFLIPEPNIPVNCILLKSCGLFLCQERLFSQVFRTLNRRDGAEIPDSLQVWLAPGSSKYIW